MNWLIKNSITAALVSVFGLALTGANTAQAQPWPIVINDPWNNQQTVIHPSALQPGAQMVVPGTEMPFQYQEKLILGVVLMPVEITFHDPNAHPGIIDCT